MYLENDLLSISTSNELQRGLCIAVDFEGHQYWRRVCAHLADDLDDFVHLIMNPDDAEDMRKNCPSFRAKRVN